MFPDLSHCELQSSCGGKVIRNHHNQQGLEENITNFVVITVPADSLEVLGARIAADTVETIQ